MITQVLVQGQGESKDDATWENLFDLQQKFPPCGQGALSEGELLGLCISSLN